MTTPFDAVDPDETLARRRAEKAAVRARLQTAAGVASPAQIAGYTGLQIFQAVLAGEIPLPPMAVTLAFTLLRIEPGFAVLQGRPGFGHYNPMGTVHGGWFATMLDSAMGCAVHSTLPAGKAYTTLELKLTSSHSPTRCRWCALKAGWSDRTASSTPTPAPLVSSLTKLNRRWLSPVAVVVRFVAVLPARHRPSARGRE